MELPSKKPLIVGISGASGAVYGIEMLKALRTLGQPTHLIVSDAAVRTIALETDIGIDDVRAMADMSYNIKDIAGAVASGSFPTIGMVIAPCSIKTLSGIVNSYADNLLIRAADVTLKEKRRLVLMVRETPLHKGHLELMVRAADLGALILPPMPAFYHHPETILDIVHQSVGKALDYFSVQHDLFKRWDGGRNAD